MCGPCAFCAQVLCARPSCSAPASRAVDKCCHINRVRRRVRPLRAPMVLNVRLGTGGGRGWRASAGHRRAAGMRSGPWNRSDRVQLEDVVMVARITGASQVRLIRTGYATIEIDLKHEKAAGDRESVQAAERSYVYRVPNPKLRAGVRGASLNDHPEAF